MLSSAEILTTLGRRSVIYLINQLMHSTDKNVRLQLVKLIPGAGASVVPILKDCLQKKPPWYVVRNIVFILSEKFFFDLVQIIIKFNRGIFFIHSYRQRSTLV